MNVYAQHLCLGNGGSVTLFHYACPQAAGSTEFGYFREEIQACGKNPADTGSKIINLLACFDCSINIGHGISEGKSDFLYLGSTCFANVISANADSIPFGDILRAISKCICNQTHGRTWREDIGSAGDIFLENIVLNSALQLLRLYALLFGNSNIHCQKYGCRTVDGHRGADLIQRNTFKKLFHVSERINCYANLADFTFG